ncbi:DUF2238 domain-containing protein [Gallaecimonas kandeliae]|uniref:DUF2238 domain-containing protein n=1 Tax=Gallaecimonas kandeliae TaxID=3029055 RepID=UPI002647CC51|nr:DUF2238 domain-containing protein [Gallaecimonas kandeliae]WKE65768.1 DUF2238 domain-containing protein [Gallaecimonas kandeliae]
MDRGYFPEALAALYALLFTWLGWTVADRAVWYAEVTPLVLAYLGLLLTAGRFRFSNLSYLAVFIALMWHTVGAHYTFSLVPMGWLVEALGLARNPYDRIGHVLLGLLVLPVMEVLLRKRLCGLALASWFAVFTIGAVGALYEIIEWAYAVLEGGGAGIGFLGAQGDPWDAQADMACNLAGALLALPLYWRFGPRG